MAKHALLIGSPFGHLTGPLPDVERMAGLLEPRGFQLQRRVDQDATREGILHAYQSIIKQAASGDAVAIYYSGHGAHSLDKEYTPPNDEAPENRYHQFIVPMDLSESSDDDFRGILSLELSSLLGQLTAKTKNVTVIFDCCHSGGMTRDVRLQLKALSKDWFTGTHSHEERFKRGDVPGISAAHIDVEGNPHAVRVMAALPSQQAWEYMGTEGAYGLMTSAVVTAFEESEGRPVTWNAINRRVRQLVQQREPGQYPDVEGPSNRFVFNLEEEDVTGVVPIEPSDDGPRLMGGRLLGIDVGDEYVVMPPGFQKVDPDKSIASATVTYVAGAWSLATLEPAAADLPLGARAFPTARGLYKPAVLVQASAKLQPNIERAIAASNFLRPASEGERGASPERVLAVVEERDGKIHIREQPDLDLIQPMPVTGKVAETVAENLVRLARARKLETLETGTGASELKAEYELDWGRLAAKSPEALPMRGGLLFVGDWIYVRVENKSESKLYVSVFDIGVSGRGVTTQLTRSAPSGVELQPGGAPLTLGYREHSGWKGLGPLYWPDGVPKDGQPRPEALVVMISDGPQDLRALESPAMAVPRGAGEERSELQRLVDQLGTGQSRDLTGEDAPVEVRYAVEHIKMLVDPTESGIHVKVAAEKRGVTRGVAADEAISVPAAAVKDATSFLIDDRPQPTAAYRMARGVKAPSAVALQLGEIVIHQNRAILGLSADVRVDALMITGGEDIETAYRAGTARFPRIKDEDRLPLDNLLVYHGPVKGFIDVAVWVSRDDKNTLSLAEMLKEQVNSIEFKDAALVLAGLAVAAPTAGAVVAGLGAATTVANVAYKLLSQAVGKTIGLYRTSLLSNEGFGVGRHPAKGMTKAQDFSFWYEVKAVD